MNQYRDIIKKALPSITEEEFELPVKETGIDSIELVLVRATLEKFTGLDIPDSKWYNFKTIQDAIDFCIRNESTKRIPQRAIKIISTKRQYEINLPQMANSALSENWLLKELGDIHWELISKGLNTKSADLKDEFGNRLYATFTRIRFATSSLNNFKENELLSLKGEIKRFGLSTYISEIGFESDGHNSKAALMTNFSTRNSIDNSRLFKSQPIVSDNEIPELDSTPEILNEYRLLRKGFLESFKMDEVEFKFPSSFIYEAKHTINPFYEINGVGLLYFAAYPIISDKCESEYFNSAKKYGRWESQFFSTNRDIFYFCNCNIDDSILYRLNDFEFITDRKVKLFSSLYRVSDMKLMAHIFSTKKKKSA